MVRPLTEKGEDFADEISEHLTATRLVHLSDILSGDTKDLDDYYGEGSVDTSGVERQALHLAHEHREVVEEFLHRDKHEWKHSQRTRKHIEDILIEQGVSSEELETYDLTYTEYLLAIYHFYYDASEETVQNYDVINAKTLLFHNNTGQLFSYSDSLLLEKAFLERKCSELSRTLSRTQRNFHADVLHVEEGKEAVVKLYREINRTPEMIFSERLPDDHPNADASGVTHRPAYPIKTISMRIENSENRAQVSFSESRSGWTPQLKDFFTHVFNIDNPFSTLEQERSESVDRIIGAVREAVVSEQEDNEDEAGELDTKSAFEAVDEELDAVREETVEQTREEEDDDIAEELDEKYGSIEPTGIIVRDVEDTLTAELSVKSDSTLEEWMERNAGARDIIESEVANANDGEIGLRFRARITSDDDYDEFVLRDGRWETESGRKVPEQTREVLDRLFSDRDE
jgi:hypothetical protein